MTNTTQHATNCTNESAGAQKTDVFKQVGDIKQDKLLAIISGHLASFTKKKKKPPTIKRTVFPHEKNK